MHSKGPWTWVGQGTDQGGTMGCGRAMALIGCHWRFSGGVKTGNRLHRWGWTGGMELTDEN